MAIWLERMHFASCPSIVFRQPSIQKCPFVYQHMKCQHSDREVPFGFITPYMESPCVAELGGWVPWRREVEEPDQGFLRCLTWREGNICTYLMINKDLMLFLFQSMFLVFLIFDYDQMFMLIKLAFHIALIIRCFTCGHIGLRKV